MAERDTLSVRTLRTLSAVEVSAVEVSAVEVGVPLAPADFAD
jgi:hypothetical protein